MNHLLSILTSLSSVLRYILVFSTHSAPGSPPCVGSAIREDARAKPDPSFQPGGVEASATRLRPILRSRASKVVNEAFLTLCDTYLANDRPQDPAKAAIKQYGRDLTAQQLANCLPTSHEAVCDCHEAVQEHAACYIYIWYRVRN